MVVFDKRVGWSTASQLLPPDVMTMLDNRFIKKAGDTVTGAITFANTVVHSAATTFNALATFAAGLKVTGGNIWVSRNAATAEVQVDSDAGQLAQVRLQTDAVDRWFLRKSTDAEAGANQGSHFDVIRCSDAGGPIDNTMRIYRNTGIAEFVNGAQGAAPALTDNSSRFVSSAWVRGVALAPSVARTLLSTTADTYLGAKGFAAGELTATAHYRITLGLTKTATIQNTTVTIRLGSAFSTADPLLVSFTLSTGTAATDTINVVADIQIDTINAGTGQATAILSMDRLNTVTGFANVATPGASGGAQVGSLNTAGAGWIGASVQSTVANIVTVAYFTIEKIAA